MFLPVRGRKYQTVISRENISVETIKLTSLDAPTAEANCVPGAKGRGGIEQQTGKHGDEHALQSPENTAESAVDGADNGQFKQLADSLGGNLKKEVADKENDGEAQNFKYGDSDRLRDAVADFGGDIRRAQIDRAAFSDIAAISTPML